MVELSEKQNEYLLENIEKVNSPKYKMDDEGTKLFGSFTDLKEYARKHFIRSTKQPSKTNVLLDEFFKENFTRLKIVTIANRYGFITKDLESFYDDVILSQLMEKVNQENMIKEMLEYINRSSKVGNAEFRFVKLRLRKIIKKQLPFLATAGFPKNILKINPGVMTANAGDSAQFLFLARAILAGFNCSNVDVRSSRYDAVIDFNSVLLRVQIKGTSVGSSVSFRDRDRGGQGVDPSHKRNKGKRVTSKDCDLFVIADKDVGSCYLIPMEDVDTIADAELDSLSLTKLEIYHEAWNNIRICAEKKEPSRVKST